MREEMRRSRRLGGQGRSGSHGRMTRVSGGRSERGRRAMEEERAWEEMRRSRHLGGGGRSRSRGPTARVSAGGGTGGGVGAGGDEEK